MSGGGGAGAGATAKIPWSGTVTSVQPRIGLIRSFDERSHSYRGYVLRVLGAVGEEQREFLVAVGEGAHEKHRFQIGDRVSGEGAPVPNPRTETAELYKVSKLRVLERGAAPAKAPPPWHGVPPALPVYRERGHRRLDARTYDARCTDCIWGCRMPVEMIIDQWDPGRRQYRAETFCYGPLSCAHYEAGPTRKVPGRRGMTWEEENWVDADAVSHRGPEE